MRNRWGGRIMRAVFAIPCLSAMSVTPPRRKALALLSGGLDSMLAVRVVQEQGIEVEGINFFTGFCVEGHTHAIRKQAQSKQKRNNALWSAEQLGIKLHIIDISEEYKDVVLNPKHGYGANLNPCLDCKIFMVGKAMGYVNRAREFAADKGFDFIITGEVVGQRPKSQRAMTMPLIARESGADDRLLRPLCAKRMAPTLPEREGWVDREKLHDFHGRSRQPQMELARQFGFTDYAQPAGGCCFLTDEAFSRRFFDLLDAREAAGAERRIVQDDVVLLSTGRHFRLSPKAKLVVGRTEVENALLEHHVEGRARLEAKDLLGAVALVEGEPTWEERVLAASIVARYGKGKDLARVEVEWREGDLVETYEVEPVRDEGRLEQLRI